MLGTPRTIFNQHNDTSNDESVKKTAAQGDEDKENANFNKSNALPKLGGDDDDSGSSGGSGKGFKNSKRKSNLKRSNSRRSR